MYHLDILAAAKRHPRLAGRGDAMVQTTDDCVASVTVGDVTLEAKGTTGRDAEAALLLELTAARFGAELILRPSTDEAVWAEIVAPAHLHRNDGRVVLAWSEGSSPDAARAGLTADLAGGSMLTPCVVCGGPGVAREREPFVLADGWPVGARRVCRAGYLCALCRRGARELAS